MSLLLIGGMTVWETILSSIIITLFVFGLSCIIVLGNEAAKFIFKKIKKTLKL